MDVRKKSVEEECAEGGETAEKRVYSCNQQRVHLLITWSKKKRKKKRVNVALWKRNIFDVTKWLQFITDEFFLLVK